jgi:hypothetical protein
MTKGHRLYGSLVGTASGRGVFNFKSQYQASIIGSWPSVVRNGLVLHYDTTNPASYPGTGTNLFDLSASGLNATGSTAISNQMLAWNQAYSTTSTSILNTDTHSLFFSIQINGVTGSWDKVFEYAPSGTDRSPGIWRWPNNRFLHWRYDPGNTGPNIGSTGTTGDTVPDIEFLTNRWYYVGVVKNGTAATVYVDGMPMGSMTVANPKTSGTAQIKIFPGYTGSTAFIKHLHIYNRVLSDAEVLGNYRTVRANL